MKKQMALTIVAAIATATPALAVDVRGASVELGYSKFTSLSHFDRFFAEGAMEIGLGSSFAVQGDIGVYRYGDLSATGYSGAVHGLYHLNDSFSVGLFLGREGAGNANSTFYGLEAGMTLDRFEVQGHYTMGDVNGRDMDMFGIAFEMELTDRVGLRADYQSADDWNDVDARKYAVGLDYAIGRAGTLYGEVGRAKTTIGPSGSGFQTFVGIGAKFDLGGVGAPTFDQRGFLTFWPGS